ncbi:hypothetical protein LUZ61_005547 [Rhynchospora tenuis]|uniref:AAA+ ATPase domain-containing protein n=1 Tax=Rhynchospora tenuis TaxID=198213 RepID=A0AAD5ZPV2_9POAL|nr:hypothetical protein LUZ61_005547 [Rhynchospora tenuis]
MQTIYGEHYLSRHSFPLRFKLNPLHFRPKTLINPQLARRSVKLNANKNGGEDFITKVLKENPSQVETKYLVGDKLVTLREKQNLEKDSNFTGTQFVKQLLDGSSSKREEEKPHSSRPVYLDNFLREFRGKLYVPEAALQKSSSELAEFEKNLKELPIMPIEDFQKHVRAGKVKSLISKLPTETLLGASFRDFIVELEEIPGEKRLQKTKWVVQLDESQESDIMKEYKGPHYEIENRVSFVRNIPEVRHPVACAVSSRFAVELATLTTIIAAATSLIGTFAASAAFGVVTFFYAIMVRIVWPLARPFVRILANIWTVVLDWAWDLLLDTFGKGGIIKRIYKHYEYGGWSAGLETLKPVAIVFVIMMILVRFTLSRRPKNFRKWDIWQGIQFGQSKPQARVDGSTGVKFSDVAGIDEAVEELQELVRYLKNPELFDKVGIKPPHGVLLEGPPGCGKTLVAKAIAGEAGVPFYQMAGSEFVEVLVGVGSARIRDLFKRAKVNKPAVVFIDEIDALGTRRHGDLSEKKGDLHNASIQERETTLNQLLIELDGFDSGKGVIFLGATNRMDLLDPALLRPGRFDRKIKILPPRAEGRLDILKVHAKKLKMSPSVDLSPYAKNLRGWSGAKLEQLIQESALVAVRKGHDSILQSDIDDAVDRLTIGPIRKGLQLSHQGQCRRAVTEVGVAITSHLLRRYEDAKVEFCERISIIPRGTSLSQIVFLHLDEESYVFEKKPQLLHRLQVLLGGRAAEEVIYGRDTSKASLKYLQDATCLARKILSIWNLENPMTIRGEPFPWKKKPRFVGPPLDFEVSLYNTYGFHDFPLNFKLDDTVARRTEGLLEDMYDKTYNLLKQHAAALTKTVKVLLDNKEIRGEHIDYIINNYPVDTPVKLVLEEKDPGSLPFFQNDRELDGVFPRLLSMKEVTGDVSGA